MHAYVFVCPKLQHKLPYPPVVWKGMHEAPDTDPWLPACAEATGAGGARSRGSPERMHAQQGFLRPRGSRGMHCTPTSQPSSAFKQPRTLALPQSELKRQSSR